MGNLRVMTAIQGYSLGGDSGPTVSGVMAPIRSAVDGAPVSAVIQFFRLTAVAGSTTPAFCKFSTGQPTPNSIAAALDYFNYVTGHTWSFNTDTGDPDNPRYEYTQTDALDAGTLEATSAGVDVDTYPDPGFNGGLDPIWNNGFGYYYPTPLDPNFSSFSGADWDKSDTRTGITNALNAVDWASLWADGTSSPNRFIYDRAQISPNQSGRLPFGPSGKTGMIVADNVALGPVLALTGRVGELANAVSASEQLGVSLSRTQIQIRNFSGPPIPYFIFETAGGFDGVLVKGNPGSTVRAPLATELTGAVGVYRHLGDGTWTHDLQIIQLPDAAMDGPQEISTTFGSRVRNGTQIGMVVGMTFEQFMLQTQGPSWADYLF